MKTINVGLVGFGMAGRVFHAPIITSVAGLKLKKVVERTTAHARALYPEVEVVSDISDLADDPHIGLVVIATPNAGHYEMASKALRAGKNVVVEKPFTVTSEEARELCQMARENGVVLSVHHNRRFDADFLTIKDLWDSGKFGRVVNYEARYDRFRPAVKSGAWREENVPGSGILYDLGSHLIDQALVLFGKPDFVTALTSIERDQSKAVDNFEIVLEYPDKRAVLKAGMMVRDNSLRFRVNGTAGSFEKHGFDVQEEELKQGRLPNDEPSWGVEPPALWGRYLSEKAGMTIAEILQSCAGNYRLYYQDIRDSIAAQREPYVTAQDGLVVIKIIELAMRSSSERRSVKFEL